MKTLNYLIACLVTLPLIVCAQGRKQVSFNEGWEFKKEKETTWQNVRVPHTWNASDPFDDEPGYYRGVGWYRKSFDYQKQDQVIFLHFEGVNQVAEVYVNDQLAGSHIGGYTAFNVKVSDYLRDGKNEIRIKVDNSHNEVIIPLKGDFNFYGGIYRDVWWIEVPNTHFQFSEFGDFGLFVSTPDVSSEKARLNLRGSIHAVEKQRIELMTKLVNPDGEVVWAHDIKLRLNAGENTFSEELPEISEPQLWSPESPELYRLTVSLHGKQGVLDEQQISVGLRWFEFTPDKGFVLNGEHLKLIGTNRHQDFEGLGNALSDRRHRSDMLQIKKMGSNFFRTAHYPQDPAVLDACDELGLLVTMEIPLDHDITDSEDFYTNSSRMMQEMIRQYYNHPSIVIWAYMNEMLLGRNAQRDSVKIRKIVAYAQQLENLTRKEDPTRYTMIPNHGALRLYHEAGLTSIPQIVGWNLYYGWYEAQLGAGSFLDEFKQLIPDKPVLITEYGAGSDPRIHSFDPVRFDFSIEWQNTYHQANLKDIMEREFVSGSAIWNFADFGSAGRNDAVPRINSKGVVSWDRTPKDSYYLYQAWRSNEPMVKIAGCDWSDRFGLNPEMEQSFTVYGNQAEINLSVNDQQLGTKPVVDHLSEWDVPLKPGKNLLEVKSGDAADHCTIHYTAMDSQWLSENTLYLNCGTNFYFTDPVDQVQWLPDELFLQSDFLSVSGQVYQPRDRGIGSDLGIVGTDLDPIYQTARENPAYKIKVSPGTYEIVFHFAETESAFREIPRELNVTVNGKSVMQPKLVEFAKAYAFKTIIQHESSMLELKVEGNPAMLQAIELKKQ